MSLAVVHSRALVGLTAHPVSVEVHLANGLPSFTLVGLADTEVKEARERVRSALQNSGLEFPHSKRITVNLAPADLPKDSGRYDLPIAIGILAASGQLPVQGLEGYEFAGELSLSGALRPVRGSLAASMDLHQRGQQVRQVLPPGSAEEAALVPDAEVYRAAHLLDVVQHLVPASTHQNAADNNDGQQGIASQWQRVPPQAPMADEAAADMRDVKGQAASKRALEIAACGGHNVLNLWLIKMVACPRLTRISACPRRNRSPATPFDVRSQRQMPTHYVKGLKLNNALTILASPASVEKTRRSAR